MNPNANEFVPDWLKPQSHLPELPKPRKPIVIGASAPKTQEKKNEGSATPANPKEVEIIPASAPPVPAPSDAPVETAATAPGAATTTTAPAPLAESSSATFADDEGAAKDEVPGASAALATVKLDSYNNDKPPTNQIQAEDEEDDLTAEEEIIANLEKMNRKKHINIVFMGHVDAGKSTISGHILYATGMVDERTMEKYEKDAKALGRESWKYAWALDTTDQERAKGKTQECGRANFETETRQYTILDAPGHRNFVPHMIGGASQADVGVLVISARKGEFETGFERDGQTREHAMLAKTSGVRQMIIVINKLDDPSVINEDGTWSKDRYDECQRKLTPYLKQVGWRPTDITWLPLSGLTGQNLKERVPTNICPWYEGMSLLDTLENLRPPERLLNAPVKLPIFEKYKEMGTMVMGKLESGVIRVGQKLIIMPNKVPITVEAISLETSESEFAEPGDNVRLRIKGVEEEDLQPGFILCSPKHLVHASQVFDVRLMILEHKSIICPGYSAVMHIHAAVEEFTITKLLAELDKKTGQIAKKNIKFAKPGMNVIARVSVPTGICVEPYKDFPQLGRFMIRDEGKTVGVGVILKLRDQNEEKSEAD